MWDPKLGRSVIDAGNPSDKCYVKPLCWESNSILDTIYECFVRGKKYISLGGCGHISRTFHRFEISVLKAFYQHACFLGGTKYLFQFHDFFHTCFC